jgi:hypothetical protein
MPTLPPPPLPTPLNTYFAIQLKRESEPAEIAVEIFCKHAKELKILFRRIEVLDTIGIGTSTYVRLRSDLTNPFAVLDKIYINGRGVVSSEPGGKYRARIPGGRVGEISHLVMHASPKPGQSRTFRGPKFKYWTRQFEAA